MTTDARIDEGSDPFAALRARAEEVLRTTERGVPDADAQSLLHELQVHQVELEMQNDELSRAQIDLTASRDRYGDLFASAPIGYVALDEDTVILEANEAAASLLAAWQPGLAGRRLTDFVARESQDDLYRHRQALLVNPSHVCELVMHDADGRAIIICLHSSKQAPGDGPAYLMALINVTEQRRSTARANRLIGELSHRLKNTLATVQALGRQIGAHCDSVPEFLEALDRRVEALGRAHTMLSDAPDEPVEFRSLLTRELEPFVEPGTDRAELTGGSMLLAPDDAVIVHLVLHELMTNAAKHGALSTERGRLVVKWEILNTVAPPRARVQWREADGPAVIANAPGFGMGLIRTSVEHDIDGAVDVDLRPDGLQCVIDFPYRRQDHAHRQHRAGARTELVTPVAPKQPAPDDPDALVAKRILVVEDKGLLAVVLVRLLERFRCVPVGPAGDIEAAMRLATDEPLDGALLDLNLHGRSSLPIAGILQQRGIPTLLVTGYGDSHIPPDLSDLPRLPKPFGKDELRRAMMEEFG